MKKFKKTLALSLALAMGLSLVACGDSKDKDDKTTEGAGSASTEAPAADDGTTAAPSDNSEDPGTTAEPGGDTAGIAAPSTDGWDDSKKIYAYSWDEDFKKKLDVVLDAHPEYKDYVEFISLGCSGTNGEYQTKLDPLFSDAKYPSLIPSDNDVTKQYSESDKTLDLYSIGFTDDMLSTSYDFAKQFGTYKGELKAVTWQATPGSVFYRRDIAKDVFGTDDPAEVQKKLADWDTFFATADELKAKDYKITSGPDDIKYAVWDSSKSPWVTITDSSETLSLNDTVNKYLELAKKLYDGDYTNKTSAWSGSWFAGMTNDSKVFCYFGCPWFIGSMTGGWSSEDGTESYAGATVGNWGAVTGPSPYHWGGTYVCVGKDTPNPELCAYILYELTCNPDIGVTITNKYGDFVNNKAANEKLMNGELSADNAAKAFLGGQDPIAAWAAAAEGLDLSNVTYADSNLKTYIDKASEAYNAGTLASIEDAIKEIESKAETELGLTK